ncbi:hypothetical protein chiPu_0005225 [Chiloscyllium punctatum]|uniref:Protein kish-B n=1 Tax=Chiloscyllium punctatum TaxID=137246 RepID=A0A401S8T1_CHIPU|nr:hypothetical protein [Chiloscyllium punctatum]
MEHSRQHDQTPPLQQEVQIFKESAFTSWQRSYPDHERVIKEREESARERIRAAVMTNVYSFDGLLVFGLLFICTCAYLKKVPRLNKWLLSEKKGVWGVFYKGKLM